MHFSSIFLLSVLPLTTLGLPLEQRDTPMTSSSLILGSPTPLTPDQIQTLACICGAFHATGLTDSPEAAGFTSICALYPAGTCKSTPLTSSSSSSDQGTSNPLSGGLTPALGNVGGLSSIASGLLGSLPITKEKRDLEERQTTSSSTGGGLDLGGTDIPGLVLGATSVPEAAAVLSGVAGSAPGLIDAASQVAGLAGLEGVFVRDDDDDDDGDDGDDASGRLIAREEVKEKRQDPLSGLTGALGGVTGGLLPGSDPVTGLLGGLTGGLTGGAGGNLLGGVTGGLTGGLPVVGSGGLGGLGGVAR